MSFSITQLISQLKPTAVRNIRTILDFFLYFSVFLDYVYPKDNKTIVFGSNNGEFISESPKALFEHIKNIHPEYDVYFYTPFKKTLSANAKIKYILRFAPIFFKAKFLVSSHPPLDFFPFMWSNRKVYVNAWHGVAFKEIFFGDRGDTEDNLKRISKLSKKTSAFIVGSKLEAAMRAKCFMIDPRKIYCRGHPRNDILLKSNNKKVLMDIVRNIPEYKKVILYAPTYRRYKTTNFFPFDDFDLQHLNDFLEKNKIIVLLRGHVYNKKLDNNIFSERIIDVGYEICNDVYSILSEVDVLITDYSSLFIDYLLLDRPCVFVPYDLEEYKEKRGLSYDDYEFWAPGYHVLTYKEFINSISEILSDKDIYKNKRREINKQLNYYQTDHSCEKVFELIDNWKKGGYR